MSKIITIQEDKASIEKVERLSAAYTLQFNAVLKAIRVFTDVKDRNQFLEAYRDLKQVVIDKAVESLPKALKSLKKEALQEMVQLPEQLPLALKQIESLKGNKYSADVFSCLDFNAKEGFELNQDKFELLLDRYRVRITDSKQIEKYNELKAICDAINEAGLISMGNVVGLLSNFIFKEGKIHPKPDVVKRAV